MRKQIKKLEEQNKKLEKTVEQIFRAVVENRQMVEQKLEEQNAVMRKYEEDLNRSNLLHQTTVQSTVLPVVAAVYKTISKIGFGNHRWNHAPGKTTDQSCCPTKTGPLCSVSIRR